MTISEKSFRDFKSGRVYGFYKEVYPSLLMYAVRCLGDSHSYLAEDFVQESIFKAYTKNEDFDTAGQLKSFLYVCIHNQAVSLHRKYQSQQSYLHEQDYFAEDINRSIIEQETIDLLYEAISKLPEDMRQLFVLSFEQGLKNAEVGTQMGISESAVKKKKAKMIQLLRDHLQGNEHALTLIAILTSISHF